MDYQALKTEIEGDEALAGFIEIGNDQAIADAFNSIPDNTYTLRKGTIPKRELYRALRPAIIALGSASEATQKKWDRLISNASFDDYDLTLDVIPILALMVSDSLLTSEQAAAIGVRNCSRGEDMFGENTIITSNDVARALRGE
jgi:hypothetical protein